MSYDPNVFAQAVPAQETPVRDASLDQSPVAKKGTRKCRDVVCIIFFAAFWIACLVILFANKLWENSKYQKTLFQPFDRMRRACGVSAADQPDLVSADYSKILTNAENFYPFCQVVQTVYNPTPAFDCAAFQTLDGSLEQQKKLRQFNAQLSEAARGEAADVTWGLKVSGFYVCTKPLEAVPGSNAECNPPKTAVFACQYEFAQFVNAVTSGVPLTAGQQFFTAAEYTQIKTDLTPTYDFLLTMCGKLSDFTGSGDRNDYTVDSVPKLLGITVCSKPYELWTQITGMVETASASLASQLLDTWPWIVCGVVVGIAVMALYLLFVRFCVAIMVWISVILCIVGSGLGAAYFIYQALRFRKENENMLIYFGYIDQSVDVKSDWYLAFGIILAIVCGVAVLLTLIFCKTIRVAIAVIKSAMQCIGKISIIFVLPVFGIVVVVGHLAWTIYAAYMMYLSGSYDATMNAFNFESVTRDDDFFVKRKWNYATSTEFVVLVYGAVWGVFLVYAMLEYMISALTVQWYFDREHTKSSMKGVTCRAIGMLLKNFGTVCMTSFITSLVFMIRLVFEYVLKRMERGNKVAKSKTVKAAIWFTRCCLCIIQKLVQWFNRNIQIYACISGEGYCKSTVKAVRLMLSKLLANGFAKGMTSFVLFLGKMLVTASAGLISAVIILSKRDDSVVFPSFIAAVLAFLISFYVLEIVDIVVDTIYFCFLYEETYMTSQRAAGGKPFAPNDLAKLL